MSTPGKTYRLPSNFLPVYTFSYKSIYENLVSPSGARLTGLEKDHYYIIHLLLNPNLVKFNRVHQKQISSYIKELHLLFRFFLL